MAEMLLPIANPTCKLGCYGERGLMSYWMFVLLPTEVDKFLKSLEFPTGTEGPFASKTTKPKEVVIFSELDFGKKVGFGCPDGAIYVEWPEPIMLFIECKANETYLKSCKKKEYNSTIKGQLELRWRLTHLHHKDSHYLDLRKQKFIRETKELRKIYAGDDFYKGKGDDENELKFWRRLKIDNGVMEVLGYLEKCKGSVYYCTITKDKTNPFNSIEAEHFPICGESNWLASKHQFCWLSVSQITDKIRASC